MKAMNLTKKAAMTLAIGLALGIVGLGAQKPAKSGGKPGGDQLYPADITFADRAGDAIVSDGLGPYTNGDGFDAGFYSASNDLVLRGGRQPRYLQFDYSNQISGSGPTGTCQEGSFMFMNIHNILGMSPGDTKQGTATFGPCIVSGTLQFNQTTYTGTDNVEVVRNMDGSWTVTSTGNSAAALFERKGNRNILLGLYSMPFQITAVCPTCS
jgi:hypothetical protein